MFSLWLVFTLTPPGKDPRPKVPQLCKEHIPLHLLSPNYSLETPNTTTLQESTPE